MEFNGPGLVLVFLIIYLLFFVIALGFIFFLRKVNLMKNVPMSGRILLSALLGVIPMVLTYYIKQN